MMLNTNGIGRQMLDSHHSNDDCISLVCAADNNYAMPLAVMLNSVISNLKTEKHLLIYVLDGGIENENKELICQSLEDGRYEIQWINVSKDYLNWAIPIEHLSAAAYLRFLIPTLLPSSLHKVIYLDCDLIVKHSLDELWNTDVQNYYVLAVQSPATPYVSSPDGVARYLELGISPDCKYFNSGVLVINLDRWRRENIHEKAIDYVKHFGDTLFYADQDVLNALFASEWKELDRRWNGEITFLFEPDSVSDAFIVHYSSKRKPWQSPSRKDADELFLKYLGKTQWSGKVWKIRSTYRLIRTKRAVLRSLRRVKKRFF